jgi:hypothetical protein
MKRIHYIIIVITTVVIAIAILYSQNKEQACSAAMNDVMAEFNNLSKECSVDADCIKKASPFGCECNNCINKNTDLKPIDDLTQQVYEKCEKISYCKANCMISTCKCITGACESVLG